MCFCRGWL
jgi:hypothetical protein